MKFKFLKALVVIALGGLATISSAGVITNTSNDSFIDSNTGLEWMDFGVNNSYSPDQVKGLLSTTYAGWNLATESQVLTLANNAFNVSDANYTNNSSGTTYASFSGSNYANWSTIEAMGLNVVYGTDSQTGSPYGYSLGWFDDTTGSLSYLYVTSSNGGSYSGNIYGRNTNMSNYGSETSTYYGTLLVKSVPEPATLSLFGLGLIGLGFARRQKKS